MSTTSTTSINYLGLDYTWEQALEKGMFWVDIVRTKPNNSLSIDAVDRDSSGSVGTERIDSTVNCFSCHDRCALLLTLHVIR